METGPDTESPMCIKSSGAFPLSNGDAQKASALPDVHFQRSDCRSGAKPVEAKGYVPAHSANLHRSACPP